MSKLKYNDLTIDKGVDLSLKEARATLDSFPTRYFAGYERDKKVRLQEFLESFFTLNQNYDTFDSKTVKREAQAGEFIRRSIVDVFLITKYYYPKVRLKTIIKFLENGNFISNKCNGCLRRVYRISELGGKRTYDPSWNNEFGWSTDYLKEIANKED